jgi:hypothetical protein
MKEFGQGNGDGTKRSVEKARVVTLVPDLLLLIVNGELQE